MRICTQKNKLLEANVDKLKQKVEDLEIKLLQAQDTASRAQVEGGGTGGGSAAKGGSQGKDLENTKKREEKYKGDLEAFKAKFAELEKENKKMAKENESQGKEMKALAMAAAQLQGLQERTAAAEKKLGEMQSAYKEVEEAYKKEMQLRKKLHNQIEDMKGKIRVYARCRPFAQYEKEKGCQQCVTFKDDMSCLVTNGKRANEYTFDEVFRPDSKQSQIFEGVSHLVQSAVDGFNVCIFAYGQTGSGKTFTMYGKRDDEELQGIAPRCMRELYELIEREKGELDVTVSCYMLELYNDQLVDLLASKGDKPEKLDIKLDKKGIVVVQGAQVKGPCNNFKELYRHNEQGMNQRHVASTAMNAESSRSHLVFSILVESKNKATGAMTLGKLTLVDLAGSERQSKTQATGERLKEAKAINMSLSALGDVISALSTGEKFVPYRNNLLTRLLQDGLGGNAKTLMFVNISPADYNADETETSLKYATRVKTITNSAAKAQESAEVAALKKTIKDLKAGKQVDVADVEQEDAGPEGHAQHAPADDVDDNAWMEGPAFEREARQDAEAEWQGAEAGEEQGEGAPVSEGAPKLVRSRTRSGIIKPLPNVQGPG